LEVSRDSLYQSLRTAHRLLRFPLADMRHPVGAFMPESKQSWQDPAQALSGELAPGLASSPCSPA